MKSSHSPSRQLVISLLGTLFLFSTLPGAAAGGTATTEADPSPPPDKFLQSFVAFSATNYFDSSLSDLQLSLSVTRYSMYSEFKFRLSPNWMLKIFPYADISRYSFGIKNQHYPFFNVATFTSNLRNAYFLNLDVTLAYTIAPGWAIVGGGRVASGASTRASFSDSLTGGGILALKKSLWSNAIDVTVGISYTTRLSRAGHVLPYFDVDVNVLPSFVKIPVNLRLLYNGGLLSYRVTDSFALTLMGRYDWREYRMPMLQKLPSGYVFFPNSVWCEYGLEVGGGFTFAPKRQNWALSILGGVEFFRNVEILTNTGRTLYNAGVTPTPFLQATFHAAF